MITYLHDILYAIKILLTNTYFVYFYNNDLTTSIPSDKQGQS